MLSQSQLKILEKFEDDYDHIASNAELWALLGRIDSPIQLHVLPAILNWDSGWTKEIVSWILEHPLCDAGTALQIYWLNDPQFWKKQEEIGDIPKWAKESHALHKKCEELYLSGKFKRGLIRFDPRDGAYLPKERDRDSDIERRIPDELKSGTLGADIPDYQNLKQSLRIHAI